MAVDSVERWTMVRGNCLCEGIRFELAEAPRIVLCHCSICRRASGAPFESAARVPASDIRLTAGENLIGIYESSPGVRRAFCRVCGSRVPSRSANGELYFVPAGLLDDDPGIKPAMHVFVGSKAPWWEITDDLPQYAERAPEGK